MPKILLYYGSSTGNTEDAAERIQRAFEHIQPGLVEVINILDDSRLREMDAYDKLILGIPTWYVGQLQADWEALLRKKRLQKKDLCGKQVALFGAGDQAGYPDTFIDAVGIVGNICQQQGAALVGRWPTTGYEFEASLAVENGCFIGLALDYENQPELTDERIATWVQQLGVEFGLVRTTDQ
ncbi:MAG: flavodoxin [Chloroflexales bacterium]|nr:flavodoxin [Chloroflexales bacterium]